MKTLPLFEAKHRSDNSLDFVDNGDDVAIYTKKQKRYGEPLFGAMKDEFWDTMKDEFWDTYDFKKGESLGTFDTKEEAVAAIKKAAGMNESNTDITEKRPIKVDIKKTLPINEKGKFILNKDGGIDFVDSSTTTKTQEPKAEPKRPDWTEPKTEPKTAAAEPAKQEPKTATAEPAKAEPKTGSKPTIPPRVDPDAWTKFGKTFANITHIKAEKESNPDASNPNIDWFNLICKDTKGRSLTVLLPVEFESTKELILGSTNRDGMKALKDYLVANYK